MLHLDESHAIHLKKETSSVQAPASKAVSSVKTPVHRAAIKGNINRVTALLKIGWPVDQGDDTGNLPAQLAESNSHFAVQKLILQHQPKSEDSLPLSSALELLEYGLDEDRLTSLHWAARRLDVHPSKLF